MPAKDRERRRATARALYARTKHRLTADELQRRTTVKRTRRQALAAWFETVKTGLACARCDETHPAVLQFHHLDPSKKEISLAKALSIGWGRDRIMREAAKCQVLCANCHMKHHAYEAEHVR